MNTYTTDDLSEVIIKTASALKILTSRLDKQNEILISIFSSIEEMKKKLNTTENLSKSQVYSGDI